jgi:hypothetical protein
MVPLKPQLVASTFNSNLLLILKFGLADDANESKEASIKAVVEDALSSIKFLRFMLSDLNASNSLKKQDTH